MVGSSKAENVFGQVLICLRMSKLDYMVKETPYSAYVTIRKKFVKSLNEDIVDLGSVENENAIDELKNVKRDTSFLKKKIADLEKDCATLRIDNEELEIKLKITEKEKIALEDDLEDALAESRELRKNVEKKKKDEKNLLSTIKELEENVYMCPKSSWWWWWGGWLPTHN
jgi:chromosome segregation ATPase